MNLLRVVFGAIEREQVYVATGTLTLGALTVRDAARTNFFDRAIVDVIIKPKGHVKSKIW